MKKTYHFLAGLPRSGNTLLSALLNQNPDVYSTPISPLPSFIWEIENASNNSEQVKGNKENQIRTELFMHSFMDNYYKDVKQPIIIEREKGWGTPDNLYLIKKYVTSSPKIIFTVRDILEILASFVKIDTSFEKKIFNTGYFMENYISKQDLICEYLMSTNGTIDKVLLSLASAFYPENKGMFHIVEYNDLMLNPKETMNKIYDFLELPHYEHNFNKIEKVEHDDDEAAGFPRDLHTIRESLSKSSTSIDLLSDYIRHKYSDMEFWRDNSTRKIRGRDF